MACVKNHGIVVATVLVLLVSPGLPAQEEAGRDRYAGFGCANCHGARGEGTALGPGVATGALSLAEFTAYLRQPTGVMPAYPADAIPDAAVAEMYAYLTPDTPESQPSGNVDAGAELYRNTGCYQCHANEAQGGAQGPRLGPDPISFPRFTWYVRHPSGGMPPYTESVMSDQDLADVYAFLEARPSPPDVSTIPLLAP